LISSLYAFEERTLDKLEVKSKDGEDLSHLHNLFDELKVIEQDGLQEVETVSFESFLNCDDIQVLINDDLTSIEELQEIWHKNTRNDREYESDSDGLMYPNVNIIDFIKINRDIDELFEVIEDEDEEGDYYDNDDDETMSSVDDNHFDIM
jgi:hypothetical protein